MKKSTNAEIKKRITEIYKMLIQAYSYSDIIRYCSEKYQVSSRTAEKYIDVATKRITKENSKDIEQLRTEANSRYNDLYNQLRKEGKFKDAGYIQGLKSKINGLENSTVNHEGSVNITISSDFIPDINLGSETK